MHVRICVYVYFLFFPYTKAIILYILFESCICHSSVYVRDHFTLVHRTFPHYFLFYGGRALHCAEIPWLFNQSSEEPGAHTVQYL